MQQSFLFAAQGARARGEGGAHGRFAASRACRVASPPVRARLAEERDRLAHQAEPAHDLLLWELRVAVLVAVVVVAAGRAFDSVRVVVVVDRVAARDRTVAALARVVHEQPAHAAAERVARALRIRCRLLIPLLLLAGRDLLERSQLRKLALPHPALLPVAGRRGAAERLLRFALPRELFLEQVHVCATI